MDETLPAPVQPEPESTVEIPLAEELSGKSGPLEEALEALRKLGVPEDELAGADALITGGDGLSGRIGQTDWRLRREGEDNWNLIMGKAGNTELVTQAEVIRKETSFMSERERAERYWESRLSGEVRIDVPQNPHCEFAIVIPAFDEHPDRILKQIESIRNQIGINPSQYEIIYVVNNGVPDGGKKSSDVAAANQLVIETLRSITDLPVFVIDKSSSGNEIKDCNVGKARNRGVAEASIRFSENKKNGWIIQSDADTYFEDPEYLVKLRSLVKQNPDVIGIAGGIIYEFSPDTENPAEIAELRQKVERIILTQKWDILVQFLRDPINNIPVGMKNFSGAHMISRSFESAVIGGLIDTNAGEDPQFGSDLEAYAAGRGQDVIGKRNEMFVVTALRESDRTESSFKKDFDQIDVSRAIMVADPFSGQTLPEFRESMYSKMEKAILDPTELRMLFASKNESLIVSENAFDQLIDHVKVYGARGNEYFYQQWIEANFGEGYDLVQIMYDTQHSQIPLTEENYQRLVDKVLQEKNGQTLIDSLQSIVGNIRVPN